MGVREGWKRMRADRRQLGWLLLALLCLAAGLVFHHLLVGYQTTAMLFYGLCLLCLVALWLRRHRDRRWSRALRCVLLVLLAAGALLFAVAEGTVIRGARSDAPEGLDCLIVLGAGVDGTEPSLSLRNRLEAALDYLTRNPDTAVIVSGAKGPGEQISEAEAMRRWLEARGIDPGRIRMEERARSTQENLRYSFALLGEGETRVALVSSEYHLCRAKRLARQAGMPEGMEVYGIAGRTTLPLLRVNYFIREALALLYLWIF